MNAIDVVIAVAKNLDGWDGSPDQAAEKLKAAVEVVKSYKPATDPRTCETCATGCLPNERVYVNPDAEDPCPGWTHRSPQSADVETVREAEKSYCIERVGANLYWGGSPMTGKYKGLDALVSISAAIRFARKEDAEMVRASQEMSSDEYVVTEHQWL